jgi:hypothetical protein
MAISVNLYTFSKKVNSTARPGTPAVTHQCVIKEPCGILNPVIGLNLGLTNSPYAFNYAYIPAFDRWYYVREWTFQNALWYASLEIDVLASWKSSIGASTCYVLRSSQSYNGEIMDMTYPATGNSTYEESQSGSSPWETEDMSNGMYVVGVAGQSTTYYLFTQSGLDLFFEYLFSDLYAADLTEDWSTIYPELKAQANPLQYITSIMWMPFQTTGTSVDTIRVGWVDVPTAAWRVDGSGLRYGQSDFSIRRHPQSSRGSYLNNSPFSTYNLFYPPWGMISLDADMVANSNTISALWGIDLRTGQGTLTIGCGDGSTFSHILSWIHTQVGLPYQVSQVLNRGLGIGNTFAPMAAAVAGIASGNYGSAISGTMSAIGDFAHSKVPSATTIGSNGGMDSLRGLPALQYEWKIIVDEDLNHRGRPLCENRQINTLSGFIMVADADISIQATKQEQDAIRAYMEGGFFYE